MSQAAQKLYGILKGINKPGLQVVPAIVRKVDGNQITAEVDGLELEGIQLQSTIAAQSGILIKPRIDSVVLLQKIMNTNDYCVILFSEIEEIRHTIGGTVLNVNKDGFIMQSGGETMLKIMLDLVDACTSERHLTKFGPTVSISPDSKLKFTALKKRLNKILKDA